MPDGESLWLVVAVDVRVLRLALERSLARLHERPEIGKCPVGDDEIHPAVTADVGSFHGERDVRCGVADGRADLPACGLGKDDQSRSRMIPARRDYDVGPTVDVTVVVDGCVVEVYACGGLTTLTQLVYPSAPLTGLDLRETTEG
jgi:hypothetical protein